MIILAFWMDVIPNDLSLSDFTDFPDFPTFISPFKKSIFVHMGTIRQKVALQGARFFAFHGLYGEEQSTGSEFIVDVETGLEVFGDGNDDISRTVNYEQLYTIISNQMKTPRKLLESVAHAILEDIRREFISVKDIRIAIRKVNPPLSGEVKNSLVELEFNR